MSLSLLWPAGLLAGLALLGPLLIHWLPRRQSRPRPFAALRFIGQHAPPRQQRRLAEWPLLLLRLLLLAVLALWLALPLWRNWPGLGLHWRAVWPGADPAALAALPSADRSVWLAPGLPEADGQSAMPGSQHSASLLRELAARLPKGDRLSVALPRVLSGLDAQALRLAREVSWEIVDPAARETATPVPRRLSLRIEPGSEPGRWLEAALAAWAADPLLASVIDRGNAQQAIPADAEAVLWIGNAPAPRWEAGPVPLLQIADSTSPSSTIEPLSGLPVQRLAGLGARLAAPLAPQTLPAVLDPDFPQRLHHLLFQRFPQPDQAPAEAVRPQVDPTRLAPEPLPLQPWLALLAALLFLVERWLASGRRRFGTLP
jgi:hypothetical protein